MVKKRGQAAMEYIAIVGFSLLIISAGAFFFFQYKDMNDEEISQKRLEDISNNLRQFASEAYYSTGAYKKTINIDLPAEISKVYVQDQNYLVFEFENGNQQVYEFDTPIFSQIDPLMTGKLVIERVGDITVICSLDPCRCDEMEDCTNLLDDDCDGMTDGADTDCCADLDNDTFTGIIFGDLICGEDSLASDCDDTNKNIYPGASERCEAVDYDCDGNDFNGNVCGFECYLETEYEMDGLGTCREGFEPVISLSGPISNAHVEEPGGPNHYGYDICCNKKEDENLNFSCRSAEYPDICSSEEERVFGLIVDNPGGSHVENGTGTYFNDSICCKVEPSAGVLDCKSKTGSSCAEEDICIASISNELGGVFNTMVGECGFYNNQICCGLDLPTCLGMDAECGFINDGTTFCGDCTGCGVCNSSNKCESGPGCILNPIWATSSWSECQQTCLGWEHTRTVWCENYDGSIIDESNCEAGDKPTSVEECKFGNDEDTVFLLRSDTTDGSQIFIDYSSNNHLVNAVGDVHHETDESVFGDSSIYFDGNGDYLSMSDSDDWNFGSDDFTIDFWIRTSSSDRQVIFTQNNGVNFDYLSLSAEIGHYTPSKLSVNYRGSTDHQEFLLSDSFITDDKWYHVAIIRNNDIMSLYINGTLEDYADMSSDSLIYDSSYSLIFGKFSSSYEGHFLNGYIDEFRISKGIARWTEDFDVPTEPHTLKPQEPGNDKYTVLMMHFDNDFKDTSISGKHGVATLGGNAQIVSDNFFGTGSVRLDGNGDYFSFAPSDDWNLGSSTSDKWTIDFWYKGVSQQAPIMMAGQSCSSGGGCGWYSFVENQGAAGRLSYISKTNGDYITTTSRKYYDHIWHHVALVNDGSTFKIYVDGEVDISAPATIANGQSGLKFGGPVYGSFGTYWANGYIDELRFSKGIARWTEDFDVPTEPYEDAPIFTWNNDDWSDCSEICGGGTQTRNVWCENEIGETIDDCFCDSDSRPDDAQACNEEACPPNLECRYEDTWEYIWVRNNLNNVYSAMWDGVTIVTGLSEDSLPYTSGNYVYHRGTLKDQMIGDIFNHNLYEICRECIPQCDGKTCGDDGCGGSCGSCAVSNTQCDGTGQCVCQSGWYDCNSNMADGCEKQYGCNLVCNSWSEEGTACSSGLYNSYTLSYGVTSTSQCQALCEQENPSGPDICCLYFASENRCSMVPYGGYEHSVAGFYNSFCHYE